MQNGSEKETIAMGATVMVKRIQRFFSQQSPSIVRWRTALTWQKSYKLRIHLILNPFKRALLFTCLNSFKKMDFTKKIIMILEHLIAVELLKRVLHTVIHVDWRMLFGPEMAEKIIFSGEIVKSVPRKLENSHNSIGGRLKWWEGVMNGFDIGEWRPQTCHHFWHHRHIDTV